MSWFFVVGLTPLQENLRRVVVSCGLFRERLRRTTINNNINMIRTISAKRRSHQNNINKFLPLNSFPIHTGNIIALNTFWQHSMLRGMSND